MNTTNAKNRKEVLTKAADVFDHKRNGAVIVFVDDGNDSSGICKVTETNKASIISAVLRALEMKATDVLALALMTGLSGDASGNKRSKKQK